MIKITRAFKPKESEDCLVWVERENPSQDTIFFSRRNIWESKEGYEIWFSGVANSWYKEQDNSQIELIVKTTVPLDELVGKQFFPKTIPDSTDILLIKI